MPYTITIESYFEFAQRHGNRPLNCGSVILFADGAMVNPDDDRERQEPPGHPIELLRRKLTYWRQAVKMSEKDFYSLRTQCQQQAELAARYANLPGPSNAMLADLHKVQAGVGFCRNEVDRLQKELASQIGPDPEVQRQRFREQYEREQQAAAAAVLAEISNITI